VLFSQIKLPGIIVAPSGGGVGGLEPSHSLFWSELLSSKPFQWCKGDNSNWLNKILHWNLLGQYQPIILWDLT
jgi:hypothetical protein